MKPIGVIEEERQGNDNDGIYKDRTFDGKPPRYDI